MRRRGPEMGKFYSGRELEVDILGKPKFRKGYTDAYRAAANEQGYVSYREAQDLIRKHYPEDPTNPSKEFAKDLRLDLAEELGLEGEEADDLKFYTAVGTALDVFHGVDGWVQVEISDPDRGLLHVEVTLDATKRPEKLSEGHKADVIIGDIPAPDEKNYIETVHAYAGQIGAILLERLRSEMERRTRVAK